MNDDTDTAPSEPAKPIRKRKPSSKKKASAPRQAKTEIANPAPTELKEDALEELIPVRLSPFHQTRPTFEQVVGEAKLIASNYAVAGINSTALRAVTRGARVLQTAQTALIRETEKMEGTSVSEPGELSSPRQKLAYHMTYIADLEQKMSAAIERRKTLEKLIVEMERKHAGELSHRRRERQRGVTQAQIARKHAMTDLWDVCEDIIKRREEWETEEYLAGRRCQHWRTGEWREGLPLNKRSNTGYESEE